MATIDDLKTAYLNWYGYVEEGQPVLGWAEQEFDLALADMRGASYDNGHYTGRKTGNEETERIYKYAKKVYWPKGSFDFDLDNAYVVFHDEDDECIDYFRIDEHGDPGRLP